MLAMVRYLCMRYILLGKYSDMARTWIGFQPTILCYCYAKIIISYVLLRKPVFAIRLGIGNTGSLGKHSMVL